MYIATCIGADETLFWKDNSSHVNVSVSVMTFRVIIDVSPLLWINEELCGLLFLTTVNN